MTRRTRYEVMAFFWMAVGMFAGLAAHDNASMIGCYVLSMLSSDRAERAR